MSFGPGGLDFLGDDEVGAGAGPGGTGIGVNSFLWRASLDTISFMPLASADPLAGVIVTDGYKPAETLRERIKINLYILRRDLRADGLRAAVFRQRREASGDWADAGSDKQMARDLEDAILAQAWQLWFRQRRDPVDPYGPVWRGTRFALSESARTTFYGRLDQLANTTILHHLRDVRRRSAGACGKRRSSKRAACTGAPDPTRKSPASALGLRWINDFTTATS